MLASEVNSTREAVEQVRADLSGAARADDLNLLRVQTRSLTTSQQPPAGAADVSAELTNIQAQLRPALHGPDEVKVAVDGLREEMAALRWQLDQREQLGLLVADLAELRAQVARIDSTGRERTGANQEPGASLDHDGMKARSLEEENALADIDADSSAPGDDIEPPTAEPPLPVAAQPELDTPSAIITEFASRTPRRMGRTLFADEG